ncbi:MAG TPA: lipopolysaccharide kinase InaA family protein [Syntrophorhabdaceae bacterium]|nr:lipopolysaccharide kinase InaA family protein [Syntrophorhabdaceae bacterium]
MKRFEIGAFTIYSKDEHIDSNQLLNALQNPSISIKKGRAGVKIFLLSGKKIACRQYVHGGLLRAITGDRFLSPKRALEEMKMLIYLEDVGIPAVRPLCVVAKKTCFFKRLYLLTFFEEETENLPEYLASANERQRMRVFKMAAFLLRALELAGIYHRDLHLDNILVKKKINSKGLLDIDCLMLVDFDRARFKNITVRDMKHLFWRLNKYAEKLEKKGVLKIDLKEKLLFLRIYERLSKRPVTDAMKKYYPFKRLMWRIGWCLESIFYSRNSKI